MKGFEKPGAYFYSNAYKWSKLKKIHVSAVA